MGDWDDDHIYIDSFDEDGYLIGDTESSGYKKTPQKILDEYSKKNLSQELWSSLIEVYIGDEFTVIKNPKTKTYYKYNDCFEPFCNILSQDFFDQLEKGDIDFLKKNIDGLIYCSVSYNPPENIPFFKWEWKPYLGIDLLNRYRDLKREYKNLFLKHKMNGLKLEQNYEKDLGELFQ